MGKCLVGIALVLCLMAAAIVSTEAGGTQTTPRAATAQSMLEMTWPEFQAAVAGTDVMLVPVGSIEEHGPKLPLGSDALGALGQVASVQQYLRARGVETTIGLSLNIGMTAEGADWGRDGTYMYPGSLTVPMDMFVRGLNFKMLARLLGDGPEPSFSTHSDGWETSLLLHYRPDVVRPGYRQLPQVPSSTFFAAVESGDASKNPSGIGGFPLNRASADIGRTIDQYRAEQIGSAILAVLK